MHINLHLLFNLILPLWSLNFQPTSEKAISPIKPTIQEEKILWNEDVKLSWDDFKGKPREGSPYSAESNLQIAYGMKIQQTGSKVKVDFSVECYFERTHSWVKVGKKKDDLLSHEQYHFHVAEYFARKLRKSFADNNYTIKNYESKSTEIFNKVFAEYQRFQAAYDDETIHGSKPEPQKKWEAKINALISKSSNYKKQ